MKGNFRHPASLVTKFQRLKFKHDRSSANDALSYFESYSHKITVQFKMIRDIKSPIGSVDTKIAKYLEFWIISFESS